MTPSVEPNECERRIYDAAPYVLGALTEDELESYREHLRSCAECAAEVATLQTVADSLALDVPQTQTPDGVRTRVTAVVGGEAEPLRAAGRKADHPARTRPRRPALLQPVLVATAALAAGLLIGTLAIDSGSSTPAPTQTIQAFVAAPGYHATASLRKSGSHLELVVANMPAPPLGRIYEVWLERGMFPPQPTDALFSVTRSGAASVGIPQHLTGVTIVLVTSEPLGGSRKPTRPPVIVASV